MKSPVKGTDEIILGVDYGEKNIGMAFGRHELIKPLKTISSRKEDFVIQEIAKFVFENRVTKIVMGLPLTYDEKDTPKAKKIRIFAKKLKIYLKKPIEFVNEYKSTEEVLDNAVSFGVPKKGHKSVDHLSAGIIVKRYYEEKRLS